MFNRVKNGKIADVFGLKPGDNFYGTNIFVHVDGTAIIFQQFKVKCASNDFGQQRYTETGQGTLTSPARLSFVLKVPLCNLRHSIINSVPCDWIL